MKTGLIIGIYFALVCCREKIQPAVVQADLSEAVYTDTTWFADCEIVFPETTDRSLISMINKIVLTRSESSCSTYKTRKYCYSPVEANLLPISVPMEGDRANGSVSPILPSMKPTGK